jgi:hypothetical protein
MSRIHVHIDRLVLTGLDRADHATLAAGLQSELRRQLANSATQFGLSRQIPAVRLGQMPLECGASGSRQFGRGLARAVAKSMTS